MKKLSEMTLEELWQLFPIVLTPHQAGWEAQYAREEARIRAFLPMEHVTRISHVGSTAINGIWAKPIVDILMEVSSETDFQAIKQKLTQNGYICMSESETRLSFNRGYTPSGFAQEVFHLHLRRTGDCDELYFRDDLNENPDAAKAYERLKLALWKRFEHDRDAYTQAKSAFVAERTHLAKTRYQGRYE